MIYHDLVQGSPEWAAHRAKFFNASDAPAMMGCSPYTTRTELLDRLSTGVTPDVDAATQRRFDDGHRFEALARPLAQEIIGDELYPVTGSRGELSASFDGLTLDGMTAFEHKTLNLDLAGLVWVTDSASDFLPLHYRVQMEQQMHVSGAERVLFMASRWDGDTLIEERHCWYASDWSLRAKMLAGWNQFAKDLAEFVPEVKATPVVAAPLETLPAVSVTVQGALSIVSNLPAFGDALRGFIAKIPDLPSTDQEFADTEAACKALKKAEEALDAAETKALAQLVDVDTMRRLVADYKALARTTRLQREKLVAARKDAIKAEIVQAGREALAKHIVELNASMPDDYMPTVPADFGGCIKNLRTVDSIRNAVNTELARSKIHASEIANLIHKNIGQINAANAPQLFAFDIKGLVLKNPEDLANVIALRLDQDAKRKEAERERIRAEEAARIEREAEAARKVREAAEEMARKREHEESVRVESNRIAREQAEAVSAAHIRDELIEKQTRQLDQAEDAAIVSLHNGSADPLPFIAESDNGARLTLGQINNRLAPVSISVAGLASLGFDPTEQVKASRLYRDRDFPAICRAIAAHVMAAANQLEDA